MKTYNYYEVTKENIVSFIEENVNLSDYSDIEELSEYLNDILFTDDSITGNASGSYTFNSFKAKEYILSNFDLLKESFEEFNCVEEGAKRLLDEEWEYCDVTIRCYILSSCIADVLENIEIPGSDETETEL